MRTLLPTLLLLLTTAGAPHAARRPADGGDAARWARHARNVTIVRDDWGIPHVYGRTDADAVFGLMYAQAEDESAPVDAGGGGRVRAPMKAASSSLSD